MGIRGEYRVPRVFILFDPTFGGASRMAITGVFALAGARALVVAGLAAEVAPDNEAAGAFIGRFVRGLLKTLVPHTEPSTEYIVIPEGNNGAVASDRYVQFRAALVAGGVHIDRVSAYMHAGPGNVARIGVVKTERSTHTMCAPRARARARRDTPAAHRYNMLRDALTSARVYWHAGLAAVTPRTSAKSVVKQAVTELGRVRINREATLDAAGRRSERYSLHGKAGGQNDDLAVVLGMAALYTMEWATTARFA